MIDAALRRLVVERARSRCEYCCRHQDDSPLVRLQIEHTTSRKHGGKDTEDNLALACIDCNLRKGSNLSGIDPDTGLIVPLFNPRTQTWAEHFASESFLLIGRTDVGRTTIRVLDLNSADRIEVRMWATRPPMQSN